MSTRISQKTLAINAMFFLELLVKNVSDVVQTLTHQRVRLLPELETTLRFRDIMRIYEKIFIYIYMNGIQ